MDTIEACNKVIEDLDNMTAEELQEKFDSYQGNSPIGDAITAMIEFALFHNVSHLFPVLAKAAEMEKERGIVIFCDETNDDIRNLIIDKIAHDQLNQRIEITCLPNLDYTQGVIAGDLIKNIHKKEEELSLFYQGRKKGKFL